MNILDIIILVVLIMGAFSGLRKGFLIEGISILALILGVLGGFYLMQHGIVFLENNLNISGKALPMISFLMIFLAIAIGLNLLGKMLKRMIDLTPLGSLDNVAGAILGLFKTAFFLSVFFWVTSALEIDPGSQFSNSSLKTHIAPIAPLVMGWISAVIPSVRDMFEEVMETFDQFIH